MKIGLMTLLTFGSPAFKTQFDWLPIKGVQMNLEALTARYSFVPRRPQI